MAENGASYTAVRPESPGAAPGALRAVHNNPVCTAAGLAAAVYLRGTAHADVAAGADLVVAYLSRHV